MALSGPVGLSDLRGFFIFLKNMVKGASCALVSEYWSNPSRLAVSPAFFRASRQLVVTPI
jgi:hypothetical protein